MNYISDNIMRFCELPKPCLFRLFGGRKLYVKTKTGIEAVMSGYIEPRNEFRLESKDILFSPEDMVVVIEGEENL
jgi:hypothetical protein